MKKDLPAQPNLEHLKAQAKDLLDAYRSGDHAAFDRIRAQLPAARGANGPRLVAMKLALHDAQSVIAREYGFASFNELAQHVRAINESNLTPETLRALMERHMAVPPPSEVQDAVAAAAAAARPGARDLGLIAAQLPILPVRNALFTAGSVAPFQIGRPSSIAAIQAAQDGKQTLAVFSQRNATTESPGGEDLHPVGCLTQLSALVRTEDRGVWVVLTALYWIRLEAVEQMTPYLTARVSEFVVVEDNSNEVRELHRAVSERVRTAAATLPDADRILRRIDGMSPLELADSTIANWYCSVEEKARYAEEPRLVERLRIVLDLVLQPHA